MRLIKAGSLIAEIADNDFKLGRFPAELKFEFKEVKKTPLKGKRIRAPYLLELSENDLSVLSAVIKRAIGGDPEGPRSIFDRISVLIDTVGVPRSQNVFVKGSTYLD